MQIDFNAVPDRYTQLQQPIEKGEDKIFCSTCRKTMDKRQFFKTRRTDKFFAGYLPECKSCITMSVDDTDPSTFLPILKEIDVPYMPKVWREMVNKKTAHSESALGKYVAAMYINQHKKYRWADSEQIVKDETESLLEAMRQKSATESEAQKAVEKLMDISTVKSANTGERAMTQVPPRANMYGLTPETSVYHLTQKEIDDLKIKWGDNYTEEQYLWLEQYLNDLQESYIISDPIAIKNAIVICKMTLKINKFLDIDDMQSVGSLSRQLDLFIKTANLAPVQQKDRQQSTFAISQLSFLLEKEGGFIPKYAVVEPKDKIDEILMDMEEYTRSLIKNEPNLETMIENAENLLAKDKPEIDVKYQDMFDSFEQEVLGDLQALTDPELEDGE